MEREIELKKGGDRQNKEQDNQPRPPINGSKPIETQRKPECEKKHPTRDGKREKKPNTGC